MVGLWKPNCSRELNGSLIPNPSENPVIADPDESAEEEEAGAIPPGAYQLLPSDMQQGLNEAINSSDNTDDDSDEDSAIENDLHVDNSLPSPAMDSVTGWEKQEISVNCDEIRSLMSNFRLPESSIPDWALDVPESSFAQFIQEKIIPPSSHLNST